MTKAPTRTALLEWKSRKEALIRVLLPGCPKATLRLDHTANELWGRLMVRGQPPDRVLVHIDATEPSRVLRHHQGLLRRLRAARIQVWNGGVLDISKPIIQRVNRRLRLPHTTASRTGPPTERIIVKTRWNARGDSEAELSKQERLALGYPSNWHTPLNGQDEYMVMTRRQIPERWWRNRELFLERFVSNRQGEFLRVYVAGSRVVLCQLMSRAQVKRPEHALRSTDYFLHRQLADQPGLRVVLPEHVWPVFCNAMTFAAAFGLDYGSIDVVRDDHHAPYIVDVNLTPSSGQEVDPRFSDHLGSGLRDLSAEE